MALRMRGHVSLSLQGILNIAPAACTTDPLKTLSDLWLHECLRVFHDRLVSPEDQEVVKRELHALLAKRFGSLEPYESVFNDKAPLLFADFVKLGVPREERAYCKVKGVGLGNTILSKL